MRRDGKLDVELSRHLVEEAGRDVRLPALVAAVGLRWDTEVLRARLGGELRDVPQAADTVRDLPDLLVHESLQGLKKGNPGPF